MTLRRTLVHLLLPCLAGLTVRAQVIPASAKSDTSQSVIVGSPLSPGQQPPGLPALFCTPMRVELRDGRPVQGYYLGRNGDSVTILKKGGRQSVPIREIHALSFKSEPISTRGGLLGVCVGAWAGMLVMGKVQDQPLGLVEANTNYLLSAVVGGIVGLSIFSWGNELKEWSTFEFSGDEELAENEQAEFREFLTSGSARGTVHLTIQGGWLNARQLDRPAGLFPYSPSPYGSGSYYYPYPTSLRMTEVNLLRKIQLTVSASPWLELGVAYVKLSEPSLSGYSVVGQTDTVFTSLGYRESLVGHTYLIVAGAEPFRRNLPSFVRFKVGGGAGIAEIEYSSSKILDRSVYTKDQWGYKHWSGTGSQQSLQQINATSLALTVFASLELHPYEFLSVGLAADYTFCPGKKFVEVTDWNLPSRVLGNTCVGFTFGVHF